MNRDSADSLNRWEEAFAWYITLRDGRKADLTDALGRKWQDWCADPKNGRIFDDVCRLLAHGGLYRTRRLPTKAELDEDRYDLSVPIAEWRRNQSHEGVGRQRLSAPNWWWLSTAIAAVGIAVLFLVAPLLFSSSGGPSNPMIYQTVIGGLKDVHLSDGTSIVLGGRTKLSVAFSPRQRAVRLLEGQAWFKVAHDPNWPFVVNAGDGTITDIGTAFVVTRDSNRVVVTVTEGTVEVSARPPLSTLSRLERIFARKPALTSIRVSQGEGLAFGEMGTLSPVKHTDISTATEWAHGVLMFDDQPLRYVIETINRYSTRRILVSHSAGALRFSGTFPEDQLDEQDIEDWAQKLQDILPITVDQRSASICIQMRGQEQGSGGFCDAH